MKILLIVDIDNTLAENAQREHLLPDWKAFYCACDTDTQIEPVLEALRPYFGHELVDVAFVTGRTGYAEVKRKTKAWLSQAGIGDANVHYRGLGDFSKSFVFKEGVLGAIREKSHAHVVVVDDDASITSRFEQLGHAAVRVEKEDGYAATAKAIAETMEDRLAIVESCRLNRKEAAIPGRKAGRR